MDQESVRGVKQRDLEKTKDNLWKQVEESRRQQEAINDYGHPDSEGEERNIDGYKASIDIIEKELTRRHGLRLERSKIEEAKIHGTNKPLQAQISDWFKRQRLAQPSSVRITWTAEKREYVGSYSAETERLSVWMVVADGTPGAGEQGGKSYLPCNTFDEQKAAITAESQRPQGRPAPRKTGPRRAEG